MLKPQTLNPSILLIIFFLVFSCIPGQSQVFDDHDIPEDTPKEFDYKGFILNHNKTSFANQMHVELSLKEEMQLAYQVYQNEYDLTYQELRKTYTKIEADNLIRTYPYKDGFKYGLKRYKDIILTPEYDEISHGGAGGVLYARKGMIFGALNYNGEVFIPFVYSTLNRFEIYDPKTIDVIYGSESIRNTLKEMVVTRYIAREKGTKKYGIIDIYNRIVLPFEYDQITEAYKYNKNGTPPLHYLTLVKDGETTKLNMKLEKITD